MRKLLGILPRSHSKLTAAVAQCNNPPKAERKVCGLPSRHKNEYRAGFRVLLCREKLWHSGQEVPKRLPAARLGHSLHIPASKDWRPTPAACQCSIMVVQKKHPSRKL